MQVDVQTEIEIDRPRREVADYAADPDNAPQWYANITSADWDASNRLQVGSEIGFTARFLGRRLSYTYRVQEWIRGEVLVMSTSDGPFAMETTYRWEDTPEGGTRMSLRNRGNPTGFSGMAAPVMAGAMRRANTKDLERIKSILELPPLDPHSS